MKLFLPIICYNHTCNTEFMMSLIRLMLFLKEKGVSISAVCISFESLICRARNASIAYFLSDPEATHMMFIDSDIEFDPEDVLRMLKADRDIIAGFYPHKYLNLGYLESALAKKEKDPLELATHTCGLTDLPVPSDSEVINVEYAPTGFMLMKRCVFERLITLHPDRRYDNDIDGYMSADQDKFFNIFRVDVNPANRKYESEDYGFCSLWRECGGRVAALTNVSLAHHGWYGYRGNLARQWTFRASERKDQPE
jgi:glycosyltransferase involved in cell wall biosynthesis